MKRTAGEYALLLELLDQALDLPADARAGWVEELSASHADLGPALRRMLAATSAPETGEVIDLPGRIAAVVRESALQPPTQEPAAGDEIGPYVLVREIGRGGMGSVWLSNRADGAFRRAVALKLPHVAWAGRLAERMARERDILAGLEHPNIARFYDAGVDAAGRPFMAMEYVEGQAIDEYCRERRLSIRDCLAVVLDVAKAVAYAHSKLIVHRDLKPANVLVTAAGAVRLLDFGIAKLLEDGAAHDARLTQFAGRLVTPDYASPEQIRGEAIGTATDVYSLAVVAYELLTGTRPYRLKRGSTAELEEAIAEVDPRAASDAAGDPVRKRQLRGDLDAILNKAMKKSPADRYATVDALASDLQRYLDAEPVLAQPDRVAYRLKKFAGRHRLGLGAASIIAVALVAATAVSLFQAHEARRQAEKATAIKNFLLQVFTAGDNRAAGSKPPGEVTALELLDEGSATLMAALDTQPAVKLELIEDMGDIYERMDAIDKELALFRRGIELADKSYGSDSPQKAHLLALIAGSLSFAGRWADSERAVEEAERAFDAGGDHISLYYAQLLKTKGGLLRGHGRSGAAAARVALQRAADLFAQRYRHDEGYVGALMYLAGADMALDDMPAAKKAADGAVDAARGLKGDASERAHSISLRASVEDQLGDARGAERDYLEASRLYASSVGTRHFFYLQNENLRGQLLHLDGRRDEGLRLIEATTTDIEAVRPASNTLANSLARLSEAYLRDGAFDGAARSADAAMKLKPAQQNAVLLSRLRLDHANALVGLGRLGEASAEVAEASHAALADGAPSDFTKIEAELALAAIAMAHDQWVQAQQTIEALSAAPAGDTRRLRHQRARLLVLDSRLAAARGDLTRAVSSAVGARRVAAEEDLKGDVFLAADVTTAEADARCALAPSRDTQRLLEQAMAMRAAILRAASPVLADTQLRAARCALAAGEVERSKELVALAGRTIDADPWLGPQFMASLRSIRRALP
ncbi:MAG TPA: serine/threonine-protein kinase [Steroidobacteraceae bacterium]|nr:serine/threonine-protein kinase [Steroidobacteraceae bacterium]